VARPWILPSPSSEIGEPGSALRSLAIDGKGRGLAAWELSSPGRTTVQVGEETKPGTWTAREPLSGKNSAPVVAAGEDGAAVVAWVRAGERAGVFLSERAGSGRFPEPSVSPTVFAPGAVEPFVTAAKGGEWLLAWCQPTHTGWGVAIARRGPGSHGWERPRDAEDVVSPNVLFANQPRIAANARGDALVAWYQSNGVPLMTYVSERVATGSFSRPSAHDHLSPSGAPVASDPIANPKPALGPRGEAAVAWVQESGRGATPIYLATRDTHGTWTKPIDLADSFSRPAAAARGVQLVFSPDRELYVAWLEDGAVVAARRGADGSWIDGGRSPARLSSPTRVAYGVTLAAGGRGGVVASWVEIEGAHDERIAARRTGAGHASWEPLEWLSPEDGGDVGAPSAAMAEDDRTIVGWASGAPGVARIVFARVE
jgi:hypothetical protein